MSTLNAGFQILGAIGLLGAVGIIGYAFHQGFTRQTERVPCNLPRGAPCSCWIITLSMLAAGLAGLVPAFQLATGTGNLAVRFLADRWPYAVASLGLLLAVYFVAGNAIRRVLGDGTYAKT